MVSAVFHSPQDAANVLTDGKPAASADATAKLAKAAKTPRAVDISPPRDPYDWRALVGRVLPPLFGMALLVAIWALLTMKGGAFPTPAATFDAAVKLFANPFYQNGPNDDREVV